jgi:hypothetical protein
MIVGILGLKGAGKDTIGDYLVENYGFEKVSFASALKDATAAIFGWDRDMLEGNTPEAREQREQPDEFWSEKLGYDFTPRYALQYIGTDVMRKNFYDGIWIAALEKKLSNPDKDYVITDVRFPNEVTLLKNLGATLVEVQRGEQPEWMELASKANAGDKDAQHQMYMNFKDVHISEWAWAGSDVNVVIPNDETFEELYDKIEVQVKEPFFNQA